MADESPGKIGLRRGRGDSAKSAKINARFFAQKNNLRRPNAGNEFRLPTGAKTAR
jgi:hypothetical protein